MRLLAVLSFVILDGVMQSPSAPEEDRSDGFAQGGWAAPYWEGVMGHVMQKAMAQPYDILFGRKTYDIFARHWPSAPASEVSTVLNDARKYVATSKADLLAWQNTHILEGEAIDAVRRLKAEEGPLLQVHGSATLIQSLLAADLIDEFRLWTFPVTVGAGKRLFGGGTKPCRFHAQATEALENGVCYQNLRRL